MNKNNQLESVKADYNKLPELNYSLRRINTKKGRYYIKVGVPKMFLSVTSVISATLPLDDALIKKMCEKGYDEWMKFLNERATYGTILHTLIAEFLISRKIDFDTYGDRVLEIFEQHKVEESKYFVWYEDIIQDMLAFAAFCEEYKIEPIAIELPMASDVYGFAGTLDLFCKITLKEKGFYGEVYKTGPRKGDPKESFQENTYKAIIDFKSGRHGHTEAHANQLVLCQMLMDENYPGEMDDSVKLFNWSPKAWRSAPGFVLTDQTGKVSVDIAKARLTIANAGAISSPPSYLKAFGILEMGNSPEFNWDYTPVFDFDRL